MKTVYSILSIFSSLLIYLTVRLIDSDSGFYLYSLLFVGALYALFGSMICLFDVMDRSTS